MNRRTAQREQGAGSGFSVLAGGAQRCCVGLVALGAQEGSFTMRELRTLACLSARLGTAGVPLAIMTDGDAPALRELLQRWEIDAEVLPDVVSGGVFGRTQPRAQERAAQLAQACRAQGLRLRDAAVIATLPVDRAMLQEAGTAFALQDAGYDACVAADAVFPARARGGLVEALDTLDALTARIAPCGRG